MKIFVTAKHYSDTKKQIQNLRQRLTQIRNEKNSAYVSDTNTWHDNFAYEQLTREEKQTTKLLADLSSEFSNMQTVSFNSNHSDLKTVGLHCHVHTRQENLTTGTVTEQQFDIVPLGAEDIKKNMYAYNAPLIKPLMGLASGEDTTVLLPAGEIQITILSIEPIDIDKFYC